MSAVMQLWIMQQKNNQGIKKKYIYIYKNKTNDSSNNKIIGTFFV